MTDNLNIRMEIPFTSYEKSKGLAVAKQFFESNVIYLFSSIGVFPICLRESKKR